MRERNTETETDRLRGERRAGERVGVGRGEEATGQRGRIRAHSPGLSIVFTGASQLRFSPRMGPAA